MRLVMLCAALAPERPNGAAIVAIQGSGWYTAMRYDAETIRSRTKVISDFPKDETGKALRWFDENLRPGNPERAPSN
jgi:hypothetical protein